MFDAITNIAVEETITVLIQLAVLVVSTIAGIVGIKLQSWIGEKRMAELKKQLTPIVERSIARAEAKGLTGDRLIEEATNYLQNTARDHISKLKSNRDELKMRVEAQKAQSENMPNTSILISTEEETA